jgi:hypothetical protein
VGDRYKDVWEQLHLSSGKKNDLCVEAEDFSGFRNNQGYI